MKHLYKIFALIGLAWIIIIVLKGGFTTQTIVEVSVISSVWITACYLPQLFQLIKTKNADGISLDFWLNLNVALLALCVSTGTVYHLYGTIGAFITELANLAFAVAVTVLVWLFQRKDKKNKEKRP